VKYDVRAALQYMLSSRRRKAWLVVFIAPHLCGVRWASTDLVGTRFNYNAGGCGWSALSDRKPSCWKSQQRHHRNCDRRMMG
jgi:hypothetical protein